MNNNDLKLNEAGQPVLNKADVSGSAICLIVLLWVMFILAHGGLKLLMRDVEWWWRSLIGLPFVYLTIWCSRLIWHYR